MGFHDMISASEAASLSGVSVATLERFAEVGYLNLDSDSDGVPLFSKREIESVFGLNLSQSTASQGSSFDADVPGAVKSGAITSGAMPSGANAQASAAQAQAQTQAQATTQHGSSSNASHESTTAQSLTPTAPQSPGGNATPPAPEARISSLFELLGRTSSSHVSEASTAAVASPPPSPAPVASPEFLRSAPSQGAPDHSSSSGVISAQVARSYAPPVFAQGHSAGAPFPQMQSTFVATEGPVPSAPLPNQDASNAAALEQLAGENRKLRHVLDLQERILTLREDEIRDLKQQRDWLQRRLERLEEKSDRDQLLLLSETQTIRKLIAIQEPKKSSFQLALEWLGLRSNSADSGGAPITRNHLTKNHIESTSIEVPARNAETRTQPNPTPNTRTQQGTSAAPSSAQRPTASTQPRQAPGAPREQARTAKSTGANATGPKAAA